VVSKIDTDARWVPFRDLALSHDLRACWSTPIKSSEGRVLGTLALYYREPREPGLWELTLIDVATQLAAIAIEREAISLRSVAHLANAVAHEINNPLTVVLGRLSMLADRVPAQTPEHAWASSALKAALRIQGIVTRMHDITQLEYMPNRARDLPPTLDIHKSSHRDREAPSGGA
jgi:signal transduction histidine kinase